MLDFMKLDAFTQGYVEAMFFTDTGYPENGDLENASFAEFAPETLAAIKADCGEFGEIVTIDAVWPGGWQAIRSNQGEGLKSKAAGRDFWYTRNGHGSGFWDGDWPEPFATTLTTAAEKFRQVDLYRGDDGRLYLS